MGVALSRNQARGRDKPVGRARRLSSTGRSRTPAGRSRRLGPTVAES